MYKETIISFQISGFKTTDTDVADSTAFVDGKLLRFMIGELKGHLVCHFDKSS